VPSLYVGGAVGACGAAYGGIVGTLIQSSRPLAFTTLASSQWFCTGTTFFYCRSILLSGPLDQERGLHKVAAGGVAGSCSGIVAAAFLPRPISPGSVVSGSIILGVLATVSQAVANTMQGSTSMSGLSTGLRKKLAAWSPMKSLSDQEYEDLLLNKLIKVEAEIAVLDDQIADIRGARDDHIRLQTEGTRDRPG